MTRKMTTPRTIILVNDDERTRITFDLVGSNGDNHTFKNSGGRPSDLFIWTTAQIENKDSQDPEFKMV